MNENKQQSSAQKSRIDVGTNVFFYIQYRYQMASRQYRLKTSKKRGIVEQVNGDLLVIMNRSGGKHNRNVREVQRV